MKKNITINDVANFAGVCKATVSYVLNNKSEQKISQETKNKVWHAVNYLNYKPNTFAQNLRGNSDKKTVAVYYPKSLSHLEKLVFFDLLENLVAVFNKKNYGVQLLTSDIQKVDVANAIITFDIDKETFYTLGKCNFIPLISVDCTIGDPLFFEVLIDYYKLNAKAKEFFDNKEFTFVTVRPHDQNLADTILNTFSKVAFVNSHSDLANITDENLLITDTAINNSINLFSNHVIYFASGYQDAKAEAVAKCVELALARQTHLDRAFKV